MMDFKNTICKLSILFATIMVLAYSSPAQENGYPALDLMVEAGQVYRSGAAECDAQVIQTARDSYLSVRQTLLADPQGLARQYQKLIPKTAYMIGWCYLRQAEISSDSDIADLAATYFDSVATDAPDHLGAFAALMVGEIRLRQAVVEKYGLLCEGMLAGNEVVRLERKINSARKNFAACGQLLESGSDLKALVSIKSNDILYELARLHSAVGDSAKANTYLDSARLGYSSSTGLSALREYYEAVSTLELHLLLPEDQALKNAVSSGLGNFNQADRPFRLASVSRMEGNFSTPIDSYDIASRLGTQSGSLALPEAYYFRGYTHLGLATDDDSLRQMNRTPAQVLTLAKGDFDNYGDAVRQLRLHDDERLRYLATRSRHKSLVLGFALGQNLSDDELLKLSSEDVKFLIRVAASTHTKTRKRCLEALDRYFREYLSRLNAGTLTDQAPDNYGDAGCVLSHATRFTKNQALFYKGIVQSLNAEGMIAGARRTAFERTAETMAQVGGSYKAEAIYVRARSLYFARKYDEAEVLLRQLVAEHGSTRALYWYAMTFRDTHRGEEDEDVIAAVKDTLHGLMLAVTDGIRSAGDPAEYDGFRINARDLLTGTLAGHFCNLDGIGLGGIDNLNCPETLSVDQSTAVPELVMYETLSEKSAIREQFAEESRKDIISYGLPKLWLAPGEVYCGRSAIPTIANTFVPIPDSVHVEYIWRGRIQFVDSDDHTLILDQCYTELETDGSSINCVDSTSTHDAYFFDADIDMHNHVIVRATKDGFYLTSLKRTSHQPGLAFFTETLARDVHYVASSQKDSGPYELIRNNDDAYSRNLVALRGSHMPPAKLVEHFAKDRYMRDYAYDQTNNQFLAVSSQLDSGLISVDSNGRIDTLTIISRDPLNSAEGIAVDNDGNIYIADWGNHRVLVLDASGHLNFFFGALGQNQTENSGDSARLTFPNRIVVEEESSGTEHPRQRHLLVSDWFGVHKFDARGRYLDSPVDTAQAGLEAGSCYEITLDGYGPGSTLRLHDLVTDQPHVYTAER